MNIMGFKGFGFQCLIAIELINRKFLNRYTFVMQYEIITLR